jgi:general stress protein 26
MRVLVKGIVLLFVLTARVPLAAQATRNETPSHAQVIAAAREIMRSAHYCMLATIGPGGQPQARIVDPFLPDSALTIWIATNPLTRKVAEIRHDSRVTLLYFSATTFEYVTVIGTAVLDTTSRDKAAHWKPEWATLYKNQNRGADFMLLRVKPSRLEVVSVRRGLRNDSTTWRPVSVDVP